MPAMAGDWPHDPRAYPLPHVAELPAPMRALPGVAELLSSRPSANSSIPAYYPHDYLSNRQQSPPVSPTEQRPLSTRLFQEPQFHCQQLPKAEATLHNSVLSSEVKEASHSALQARQDSAIDQHRFVTANDTQSSKSNISYSHQTANDSRRQPSPKLNSHQPATSTSAHVPLTAPPQLESLPDQARPQQPARQHSKSLSSALSLIAASSKSHVHGAERTTPVDIRNGFDSKTTNTGPPSLPEQFHSPNNSNGTRQQRYNVRFAANYTSENMPPSQKPRNDPPTPTPAPATAVGLDQPTSSPPPVASTEEAQTTALDGTSHHVDTQLRTTRDTKDRGDREPSVERCSGCNEAWRRPIPDLDSRHISPAETNAEFMQIASNMIERLRDQRKKADAAYDEWRWRHSRCNYRLTSPSITDSLDDAHRKTDAIPQPDVPTNNASSNKRKSDIPQESQHTSKHRKTALQNSAPPVRQPDSS